MAVLILSATIACGIAAGRGGVFGALIAGLTVVIFFASSPLALGPLMKELPGLSLAAALAFFFTKVAALAIVLFMLLDPDGLGGNIDQKSLGGSIIVLSLAWTVLQILASKRRRILSYDLGDDSDT